MCLFFVKACILESFILLVFSKPHHFLCIYDQQKKNQHKLNGLFLYRTLEATNHKNTHTPPQSVHRGWAKQGSIPCLRTLHMQAGRIRTQSISLPLGTRPALLPEPQPPLSTINL